MWAGRTNSNCFQKPVSTPFSPLFMCLLVLLADVACADLRWCLWVSAGLRHLPQSLAGWPRVPPPAPATTTWKNTRRLQHGPPWLPQSSGGKVSSTPPHSDPHSSHLALPAPRLLGKAKEPPIHPGLRLRLPRPVGEMREKRIREIERDREAKQERERPQRE